MIREGFVARNTIDRSRLSCFGQVWGLKTIVEVHKNEGKRVGRPAGAKFWPAALKPLPNHYFLAPRPKAATNLQQTPLFSSDLQQGGVVTRNTIDEF